jgi:tetraacyldisaccharide 4'-kinase
VLAALATQARKGVEASLPPVIVVGNIIVGGAGKTPIVAALVKHLAAQGFQPGIVSRGYGRKEHTAGVLTPSDTLDHTTLAAQFGDEPVWLAATTHCPVAVSADRNQALRLLVKQHPDTNVVISDDGLSHAKLTRAFEIVVFDQRGIGNGHLLPAGPLRQTLARLQSVDMLISNISGPLTGTKTDLVKMLGPILGQSNTPPNQAAVPHYQSSIVVKGLTQHTTGKQLSVTDWQDQFGHTTSLAFAGMANPSKFFSLLKSLNINAENVFVPDHFSYPPEFTDTLKADTLLTTGKDAVKLQKNDPRLWVVDIEVQLPEAAFRLIEDCLRGH